MQKFPQYIAILLLSVCYSYAQSSDQYFYKNIGSQSFTKQNKYFLNPTLTISNTNGTAISILVRNSFKDFQNSPTFNLLGFSGKINEKYGAGIGIFQQDIGVFTSFGAIANYSQKLQVSKNSNLFFGFNFIINKNSIDRSKIEGNLSDPLISNFVDSNIIVFQPALSYQFNRFLVGVYIKDFLDYDLNKNENVTPFTEKTIATLAMYTLPLNFKKGLFDESSLQLIFSNNNTLDSKFTFSTIIDMPNVGWLQTSYDDLFGIGVGLGVNISKKISINFIYEQGKNMLGVSNEIGITYNFDLNNNDDKDIFEFQTNDKKLPEEKITTKLEITEVETKNKNPEEIDNKLDKTQEINTNIKTIKLSNVGKIPPGYYFVVNVFSIPKNAENFIIKLKEELYEPNYFIHPETNFWYVYLAKTKTREELLTQYQETNLKNYPDDKWIFHVE